jgi:endonuclease YncB( thermonuclease family)
MFLKTPWLIPLLLAVFATGFFYFQAQPQPAPRANPEASKPSQPRSSSQKNTTTPRNPSNRATKRDQNAAKFLAIGGAFIIEGKSPDGDSMRFKADKPELLRQLKNPGRIRVSKDGTVQLRFEGIDAPELHFGDLAQPLGAEARDALFKMLGFKNVRYSGAQVRLSEPSQIRGAILSQAAEGNGRPISYAFFESSANGFQNGTRVVVDQAILRRSLNWKMLEQGWAYLTVYSSTPTAQREALKTVARQAREQRRGVWKLDQSANFKLDSPNDIGPTGQLILPKFFRRASSYFQAINKRQFKGSFVQWLRWTETQARSENDRVRIGDSEKPLSDWFEAKGKRIGFNADLLEAVFVEK